MDYLVVKWLHIMSSTFLFGTGVGSAFYMLFATLSRDTRAVAVVTRYVTLADWLFTTTTVFIQPITGYLLMRIGGFSMSSKWIMWSVGLYALAVVCWLPVVWLQYRLRRTAAATVANNSEALPPEYWRDFRWWVALGVPAFFAFVAIFYLMVAKPG
jgi:uncharacterized membrane protein